MDLTTGIILILIGGAIGFLVGLLLSSLRSKSSVNLLEKPSVAKGWKDLISLGRRSEDRHFMVEIDEVAYFEAKDLTDAQRDRLITISDDFRKWLQIKQVSNIYQADQPARKVSSIPSSFDKTPIRPQPEGEKSTKVAARLSIVVQIDEILQEKLQDSPYANQGIRLMELPDNGMVVVIGLNKYPAVNEVPDGQVRKLIQEAVADWEKLATS